MKCPKCGYNSFEFYDSCKKCAQDLTGYKETYGLKSIVLPLEARTRMAEALIAESAAIDQAPATSDAPVDMFSFDIPGEGTSNSSTNDPFNFDDPVSPAQTGGEFSFDEGQQSPQAKADEDAFADLLESTSQTETDPTASASANISDSTGESDLTSFSWDDTSSTATGESAKAVEDDFNSLFGDTDETTK
jgi:hypothetical protein